MVRLRRQGPKRLAATYPRSLNKYREIQVSVSKHWYVVVELVCFFFLVLVGILCVLSLLLIFDVFPSCYI